MVPTIFRALKLILGLILGIWLENSVLPFTLFPGFKGGKALPLYVPREMVKGSKGKWAKHGPATKRNLTFNLLDPDQIRLTLCYTDYFSLEFH